MGKKRTIVACGACMPQHEKWGSFNCKSFYIFNVEGTDIYEAECTQCMTVLFRFRKDEGS